MKQYLKLLHPFKSFIAGLGVIIGYLLIPKGLSFNLSLIYGFLAVFFAAVGGSVLNDYSRLEEDRLRNPEKPLPSGKIDERILNFMAGVPFIIAIILSYMINLWCLIAALIGTGFLILYELVMRKTTPLFDNIVIGFLMGSIFLFGGFISKSYVLPGSLAILSSLVFVGRSITVDIQEHGNLNEEIVSLPSLLGKTFADWTTGAFLIAAVILSPVPYFLNFLGRNYLFIISIGDIILLYAALKLINLPETSKEVLMMERIGSVFIIVSFLTILI